MLSESARPFVTREFGVKRSGSTRKKLRQDWNRLTALGAVDVVNDRTPDGAAQAFESFLALEKASWKGAEGTALLSDPRDAAFVRRLLQNLAAQGNASVALLRVDGEAIAAQVLMYCGTTAYTWKTAFNAKYAKYSPGALLIDKITDELFAGPASRRSIPARRKQVSWPSCGPGAGPWSICWSTSARENRSATDWKPAGSSATSACGTCATGCGTGSRAGAEETGHGIASVGPGPIYYPGNIMIRPASAPIAARPGGRGGAAGAAEIRRVRPTRSRDSGIALKLARMPIPQWQRRFFPCRFALTWLSTADTTRALNDRR